MQQKTETLYKHVDPRFGTRQEFGTSVIDQRGHLMNPLQPVNLGTARPGPLTGSTAPPLEQQHTTKVQVADDIMQQTGLDPKTTKVQVVRRGKYADTKRSELADEARTLENGT